MELVKALGSSVALSHVLVAAVAIGALLLVFRRTRTAGKRWLLALSGLYLVFGMPVVANAIAGWLRADVLLHPAGAPVHTLVLFDGDNRRGRLAVALALLSQSRPPGGLHVLSDEWLPDELEAAGHPRSSFAHDESTTNTRDQVEWVRRHLDAHAEARVTVIVSRLQARRVAALARTREVPLTIVTSPIDDEPPATGWRRWAPSYIGLRASRDGLYEVVALAYYRWKGWVELASGN